jgi:CAAX protease family protein
MTTHRSWTSFGFSLPDGWQLWTSIALFLLLTAYHASAVATLSRSSEQRANLRQQFSRGVAAVLPRTRCCARGRRQAAGM